MHPPSTLGIALLGSAVIAVTYGLARFVFGLFLPAIRSDLGLDATGAGIVGALPFISFIGAILIGPAVCRILDTRWAGGLAVGLAAAGLATIASAPGVLALGVGVAVCGISTGLSSPVMAQAVHRAVRPALRGRVNATHNAATSIGVALAMPAMVWWLDAWRSAYTAFAVVAVAVALAALFYLPGRPATGPTQGEGEGEGASAALPAVSRAQWRAVARLSALAAGMGLVSGIYWVFAPDLVVREGGLSTRHSSWMWLAVGLAGLTGSAAGDLIDRMGAGRTHALALALMACSLGLAAAAPGVLGVALVSAAAFGAAYMTLTGFYLVQGVRIMAERPALGPVMPLLATTVGQAVGSPLSGWMIDAAGYTAAFAGFAVFGLAVAVAARRVADG
ncbi:DHA1 family inner membrane transport protein [Constrictibacter sp. MBR-5]|uniref:MFS transporter n=1 Tax=Constrictibacter sp. MBR-5 TaxID=3156467 RepID=UPI00339B5C3C